MIDLFVYDRYLANDDDLSPELTQELLDAYRVLQGENVLLAAGLAGFVFLFLIHVIVIGAIPPQASSEILVAKLRFVEVEKSILIGNGTVNDDVDVV